MAWSWAYSPKVEKYIPLADFPADKYLIIVQQVVENLGWKLSHLSETGLIAYTGLSWQSYSEEVSIRILNNFAIVKSECVGIQLNFTDYGKNDVNLDKFFHEFEYVEFHLKDVWQERLTTFHEYIATQDDGYFDREPLTAKNKIKNVLYLFYPQKNYFVTPIIINLNIVYWLISLVYIVFGLRHMPAGDNPIEYAKNLLFKLGANDRELVLNGQYWRLISHQFMHGSLSHLFFNMYALIYIGLMIENKLGSKQFFVTYMCSGICGGLVSILFHVQGSMIGASGAIMGLFGAFVALLISKTFEKSAKKALLISTLIVVAIMLLNGLRGEKVDNAAHIGGLVSGFIICYLLFNNKLFNQSLTLNLRYATVCSLVLCFMSSILYFTPNYQIKTFYKLQTEFNLNSNKFNQVYEISPTVPKQDKLQVIKTSGIDVWKQNRRVVQKMKLLTLDKVSAIQVKFNQKITEKAYKMSELLFKEYNEGSMAYRDEIEQITTDINTLRYELSEQLATGS